MGNGQTIIDGVSIVPLKQVKDARGAVMHHINHLSPSFRGFQESYISKTFPGMVKAWKLHKIMTQNFCVPLGSFEFVLFDDREGSSTRGLINKFVVNDDDQYALLTIPNMIWYGFKCISEGPGLIVNLSNLLHDPNEVMRLDEKNDLIPYNW